MEDDSEAGVAETTTWNATMFQNCQGMTFNNATFSNIQGWPSGMSTDPNSRKAEIVKISKWLTSINFRNTQNDTFKKHTRGTGRWLLDSLIFRNWVEGDGRALWVMGMPGAGKTILSSIVVDHLQDKYKATPGAVVLCAYCRYHDRLSEQDIFASLTRQLVDSDDPELDFPAVQAFYDTNTRQETQPTAHSLLILLEGLLAKFKKVVVSIDAVDEIRDAVKEQVLIGLSRLNASCFITSRPLESLLTLLPNTQSLRLESALLNNRDIEFFILSKIDTIPRLQTMCKGREDLRGQICERLKAKSAGMFLLCALHIESLRRVTTVKKMWEAIESLPSGIEDMYQCTWDRILAQEGDEVSLARRAIALITYTKQSLRPMELQKALAVSLEARTCDPDDVPDLDLLIAVCCGLITLDEKDRVVRLVHYTTNDFFVKMGPNLLPAPRGFMAMTCVTYLSAIGFPQRMKLSPGQPPRPLVDPGGSNMENEPWTSCITLYPFFGYAYEFWGPHTHDYEVGGWGPYDPIGVIDTWTHYPVKRSPGNPTRGTPHMLPDIFGLAHLAARFAITHYLPLVLSSKDDRTKAGLLPLHIAARHGQKAIIKALLDDPCTNVNATTSNYMTSTALILACEEQHLDSIELLLSHNDIDVNFQNENGTSELICAACQGREKIARLLLSHPEIDVNLQGGHLGRTALMWAAWMGHLEILRLILSHPDVDVNLRADGQQTALAMAIRRNHVEVAKTLLSHPGIDSVDWGRILLSAADSGAVEGVRFLLSQNNVDVNFESASGRTALSYAAYHGYVEVVGVLLAHPDIDVAWMDHSGETALTLAGKSFACNIEQALDIEGLLRQRLEQRPHGASIVVGNNIHCHYRFL